MASIHRDGDKPNWFCHFYDPEGFRRNRSAGTKDARIAKTICLNIERGASLARDGKLSNERAMKLIRETCSAISETHGKLAADQAQTVLTQAVEEFVKIAGGELTTYTTRSWLESWLKDHTDASKATMIEYRRIVDLFIRFLGARADRPLSTIQSMQVEKFKEHLSVRVAPSTVNKAVKVLKASFSRAVAKRQLDFSPAEHVEAIQTDKANRRPFAQDELGKLLKAAKDDWRTMVLLGYYTGQRLHDCANLTWENVDLLKKTLQVTTEKTDREQGIPIHDTLEAHLSKLAGDNPLAPLCPALFGKPSSWLSAQFYQVMVDAKLVEERGHQAKGNGRDGKRAVNRISFHSLRYSATSDLKSSGVNDSVAMDIIGHETAAISRNYTKIDESSKRAAIGKLPDITKA